MPPYRLTEYETTPGIPLTVDQRDRLRELVPGLTATPAAGERDRYDLTAGSLVGVVQVDDVVLNLTPKISIDRVLFLVSYALDSSRWHNLIAPVSHDTSLLEAVIPAFVHHTRNAFRRGLLQGYRTEEDSLATVRGRIRFDDQIRNRYGTAPPVEVRYDEFTEDILENRLIKAAIEKLRRIHIRSASSRHALHTFDDAMARVRYVDFHPRRVPQVSINRLNEHYRPATDLACLILEGSSIELDGRSVAGSAFVVDMNHVFERFVYTALREQLGLSQHSFPRGGHGRKLALDRAGRVKLEPDLSWWNGNRCVWIGDVKYKRTASGKGTNPDLSQMLAYLVATNLESGMLIYAETEAEPAVHKIVNLDRTVIIETLPVYGTPAAILDRVEELSARISASARMRPLAA